MVWLPQHDELNPRLPGERGPLCAAPNLEAAANAAHDHIAASTPGAKIVTRVSRMLKQGYRTAAVEASAPDCLTEMFRKPLARRGHSSLGFPESAAGFASLALGSDELGQVAEWVLDVGMSVALQNHFLVHEPAVLKVEIRERAAKAVATRLIEIKAHAFTREHLTQVRRRLKSEELNLLSRIHGLGRVYSDQTDGPNGVNDDRVTVNNAHDIVEPRFLASQLHSKGGQNAEGSQPPPPPPQGYRSRFLGCSAAHLLAISLVGISSQVGNPASPSPL